MFRATRRARRLPASMRLHLTPVTIGLNPPFSPTNTYAWVEYYWCPSNVLEAGSINCSKINIGPTTSQCIDFKTGGPDGPNAYGAVLLEGNLTNFHWHGDGEGYTSWLFAKATMSGITPPFKTVHQATPTMLTSGPLTQERSDLYSYVRRSLNERRDLACA